MSAIVSSMPCFWEVVERNDLIHFKATMEASGLTAIRKFADMSPGTPLGDDKVCMKGVVGHICGVAKEDQPAYSQEFLTVE